MLVKKMRMKACVGTRARPFGYTGRPLLSIGEGRQRGFGTIPGGASGKNRTMNWSDDAIVLSARRHGESSAVVQLLTRAHGRHAGLVRGASGRAQRGVLQPGNEVQAEWRARLAEHLGAYRLDLAAARAAPLLDDPPALLGLSAACAMAEAALPEREPHAPVYEGLRRLLDALADGRTWPIDYVRWELDLLRDLGFGLDLTRCAATGATEDLVYVSPRTGRAVSAAAGEPYRDRLLRLPAFLAGGRGGPPANREANDVRDGLVLVGHFLEHHLFGVTGARLPAARVRLLGYFSKKATISGAI